MSASNLAILPYQKSASRGQTFPVIPLQIFFENKVANTSALVDSGATISIFRSEVAEQLGIKVEMGEEIYLSGIGGRIKGFLHKLKIEAVGKQFICPIVFSYEFTTSFSLIGRKAFFPKFLITFDEKNEKVHLNASQK